MPTPESVESASQSIAGHIDHPAEESVFSAWIHLHGWCFSEDGEPVAVRAHVDGQIVAEIPVRQPRPDVAAVFPSTPGAASSGFEVWLPKRNLPDETQFILTLDAFTSRTCQTLGTLKLTWVPPSWQLQPRGDYRQVWDSVSTSYDEARVSVCATADLAEYERSGIDTAATIEGTVKLSPSDVVLEIGCGTGRIGLHLAGRCARWIGADVSPNMLAHAQAALCHLHNVSFCPLNGSDLEGFADNSVDVAYCSGVFMHLDEWDRYRYVEEMFRVLKPRGRVYFDNFNLLSKEGWAFFLAQCRYDPIERPPNISKSSTPQELERYAVAAGFADVHVYLSREWVTVWGWKPEAGPRMPADIES